MSFPTKPAFIHHGGGWSDETRAHPAMEWMEKYTNAVDRKVWNDEPSSNWMTNDHKLHKSTGEVVSGGDASFASLKNEIYAPLKDHLHDPQYVVCWEVENGWEMLGVATLYYNLAVPGEGNKVKGRQGKEWDGAIPSAFDFRYVKQSDGGIKLSRTAIFSDPTAAVVGMLKRGMMKPEDLLK